MALTDGLVSYWPLNEAAGTRFDSHGSNDLADDSSVGSTTGKIDDAALFVTASTDSLSHADNTDLRLSGTDATICCWVKLSSKSAGQHAIVSKWNFGFAVEYGIDYSASADRFRFVVGNGSANFLAVADLFGSPTIGEWCFVQATIDNTSKQIAICVNNAGFDAVAFTGTIKNGSETFYVGRRNTTSGQGWADAAVDELGIWKRKLTDDEFSSLYNSGDGLAYPLLTTVRRQQRSQQLILG
jgi:hypothetical protein